MTVPASPRVGDRARSRHCRVTTALTESGAVLPDGSALLGVTVADLLHPSPAPGPAVREKMSWLCHDAVRLDDSVRCESVVTRVAPVGDHTVMERRVQLLDNVDAVREESFETWRLPIAFDAVPATDFCTVDWGVLVRDSLAADAAFASSLATWDGTIGLRCDDREVHLRVYRGRIVDVTRRTPGGATFTFVAPGHTWVDVVLGAKEDFMRRAISGEFSSTGNGYEYLRLTKPLNVVIAHARSIAREAQP